MISLIYWRKASDIGKHLYKSGGHSIIVMEADGDIREAHFDTDKQLFFCLSDGDANEFYPMEPQPKYWAFKPKPIKFWWNK